METYTLIFSILNHTDILGLGSRSLFLYLYIL